MIGAQASDSDIEDTSVTSQFNPEDWIGQRLCKLELLPTMFLDSGLCEMPKADGREKTWVLYERSGIAVDASSSRTFKLQTFKVQVLFWRCIRFWKRDPDLLPKKHSS